jgi:hypothetical protein
MLLKISLEIFQGLIDAFLQIKQTMDPTTAGVSKEALTEQLTNAYYVLSRRFTR